MSKWDVPNESHTRVPHDLDLDHVGNIPTIDELIANPSVKISSTGSWLEGEVKH